MPAQKSEFEKAVYEGGFRVLLTKELIAMRIDELGQQITRDYRGLEPIIIGVLNGAFIFMADLIRRIEIDVEVDFIKISSYGDAKMTSGQVVMLKDINAEIAGRHVLLVEDIVDTGLSIEFLRRKFTALNPASLKYVTFLFKPDSVKSDIRIDYVGFEIPSEFVVGYGLDHKQILRNLPAVYIMD
ncbi:hypoxanthine phosphoribosyltransferase [candidate division KSB1 bacterium]|nr:hypoxanthine phosphoribosyltransferase [candidate division KSB1 bacterium]